MKITILSDSHLKSSDETPEKYDAIEYIFSYSVNNGIQNIIFAGDTFDSNLSSYGDFDNLACNYPTLNIYLIRGNHDSKLCQHQFTASNIFVIENPQIKEFEDKNIFLVPFIENKYAADIIEELNKKALVPKKKILISHCDYISKQSDINELEKNVYMPLFKRDIEEFEKVILGHIHKQMIIDEKIFYCGSAFPSAIDEIGDRYFIVYDLDFDVINLIKIPTKIIYFSFKIILNPFENIDEILNKYLSPFIKDLKSKYLDQIIHLNLNVTGFVMSKKAAVDDILKFLSNMDIKYNLKDDRLQIIDSNMQNHLNDAFSVYNLSRKKIEEINIGNELFLKDKTLIHQKILELIIDTIR